MVFCFGELLLRLSPELSGEWIKQNSMPLFVGGAELNVASALARWDVPVAYCTSLPDDYLSREIIIWVKQKGIDAGKIVFSGNRIGTYYLPQGGEMKDGGVIYNRDHSSFSELKPGIINWEETLNGCTWFHFSAISPALNGQVAAVCEEALKVAAAKGLTISVDLNYRAQLWKYGKEPVDVMPQLAQYCNVIMGNIWAAEKLLGITSPLKESKGRSKEELIEAAGESMKEIHIAYPNITSIAYTFRMEQTYFAVLQHGPSMVVSKEFYLENVIDKVGSGDCFMAGLIYGLYNEEQPKELVEFAAAAAVGKMQEKGDATNQTLQNIQDILQKHAG